MEGLNRIFAVAQTTFRETIRNKILLHMLAFAAAMFALSWVVSHWSLGDPDKIVADLGLAAAVFIGVVIALFTAGLFITGKFSADIRLFVQNNPLASSRPMLEVIYALVPHLGYFNVRHLAVHSLGVPWDTILWSSLYGALYSIVVLAMAVIVFRARDLV